MFMRALKDKHRHLTECNRSDAFSLTSEEDQATRLLSKDEILVIREFLQLLAEWEGNDERLEN